MSTTLVDCVIHWRKKLDKNPDDDDVILNVIRKLSKIPITVEILQTTHIGKCIRKLSKRNDLIGEKAKAVLNKWRDIFALQTIKDSKMPIVSNEDNIKKEKSSKKHGVAREKILNHHEIESHHKNKHQNNSLYNSIMEQSSDGSSVVNSSVKSSHLPYNNSEVKKPHKNMDYDPNTECSQTYDPEYPEFFPTDNNTYKSKERNSANKYKPSPKRKLDIEEQEISVDKSLSKKPKMENYSLFNADNAVEIKRSHEKDRHSFKKNKNKDHNSHSSSLKKDPSNVKSEKEKSVKHASSLIEKKRKDEKNKKNCNSKSDKSDPKVKIHSSEEFTSSHVSFEACLGFNDIVDIKKKKSSKIQTPAKKPSSTKHKTKFEKNIDSPSQENKTTASDSPQFSLPSYKEKLKHSIDMVVEDAAYDLPENLSRQLFQLGDFHNSKKKEVLSSDDVIKFTSSRKDKTAVYSGKKSVLTKVPTLIECCTRILIENIDELGYMGGVPYFLLKPVLERCSVSQLYSIESYNCDLLDYTNELWEKHCKRDCKLLKPHEHETWRDLYLRAQDERERKLKNVTANISASISKSKPVRKVKLAYVDSFAKPPRDVARKQAKNGTSIPGKTSSSSKANSGPASPANTTAAGNKTSLSNTNLIVKCGSPKSVSSGTTSAITSIASNRNTSLVKQKPKIAPLMAKTLKSMKQVFRR